MGRAHEELGDDDEAVKAFAKALLLKPGSDSIRGELRRLLNDG